MPSSSVTIRYGSNIPADTIERQIAYKIIADWCTLHPNKQHPSIEVKTLEDGSVTLTLDHNWTPKDADFVRITLCASISGGQDGYGHCSSDGNIITITANGLAEIANRPRDFRKYISPKRSDWALREAIERTAARDQLTLGRC